ncbi:MAG: hypothetical protein Kow00108_26210 [Calditrichia bacterium]
MNTAIAIQNSPKITREEIYQLLRSVIIGEQTYTSFYSDTLKEVIGIYKFNIPGDIDRHIDTWYDINEMKAALRMTPDELKRFHYFKKELIG